MHLLIVRLPYMKDHRGRISLPQRCFRLAYLPLPAQGTRPAGSIIRLAGMHLNGRLLRLPAYGGTHRSGVPERERRGTDATGTAEEGSGVN
ncbi:MAG: hypothetical protein ABFD25_07595 [Clostridiaceae bacterium]